VTHGQCDARPTVTFPASSHHRPLTGTKLYCLVTEAHVCVQLTQGCYLTVLRAGVDSGTFRSPVWPVTVTLPSHILMVLMSWLIRGDHSSTVKFHDFSLTHLPRVAVTHIMFTYHTKTKNGLNYINQYIANCQPSTGNV